MSIATPEMVKVVAARARGIEDLQRSGKQWTRWLLKEGIISPGKRVLDFGAGVGRLSIPLQSAGCEVVAIDRRQDMTDYLQSQGIEAHQSDDLTPVKDQSFDAAFATFVLQHMGLNRARDIIAQIAQVTSRFYFTIPTTTYWSGKLPGTYQLEQGQSDQEMHTNSEVSYVYQDSEVFDRLISPHFDKARPLPRLRNAGLWVAE